MIQSIEIGRKEDGNRSIADKIIKRLHDIEMTIENNHGRWAWELLQNAKDSIAEEDRKVSVEIELSKDCVVFRHNGTHFSEKDIRGLINQISSKEVEEGEISKRTGKFGTGFLTTHLLSKVIQVDGIVETIDNEFYRFSFPLDREGKTTQQLVPKIENAWTSFHQSTENNKIDEYDGNDFNTSFTYNLDTPEQKEIAAIGVNEFKQLIPFVLAFIPVIDSVNIIDKINNTITMFKNSEELEDNILLNIIKIENKKKFKIKLLFAKNENVAIASIVEEIENGYAVKNLRDFPKLFCDFPLIGTEDFYFPIIVNSFYFNPLMERDGIWLKGDTKPEVKENRVILEKAVELYKDLLTEISEKLYYNLFNIIETSIPTINEKFFDDSWYRQTVQKPLRDYIIKENLVEIENSLIGKKAICDLWFPLKSYTEAIQEKLWQFTFDLFPESVCKREYLLRWCEVSWENWNKINHNEIVNDLSKQESIQKLSEILKRDENGTFKWLNSFGKFLLEDDNNLKYFENCNITPNQNGVFKKRAELNINRIKDDDLIEILGLLGEDWKDLLLHENVAFGRYTVREKKHIANRITEKLKNPSYKDDDSVKAISLLSEWFENHKQSAKEIFSELYKKKAELFMNTITDKESLYKVMRSKTDLVQLSKVAQALSENPKLLESVQKAEELTQLLKEFNVKNVTELKLMLLNSQNNGNNTSKIEITQDILISLGVTTVKELEEALKDNGISTQFYHTSTPNLNMFLRVQSLINRSKENIINHLKTLPDYDCSELEELATTVLGGIRKNGLSIHVVIRPSDNGTVIVYYSSEKDTLDYENAELWIDNGTDEPRHLTLGKILKTTGINRIPV